MRQWKKQVAACISGMMLLSAFSIPSLAAEELTATKTNNANSQNYAGYMARIVTSYLVDNDGETLSRVEWSGKAVIVEDYSKEGVLLDTKTIEPELGKFGGFYAGEEYNFLVFGQDNPKKDNNVEVVRVIKYSKDWKRLGSASIYGANTARPFAYGTLRMTESDGILFVRTCHDMYNGHQSNFIFSVDTKDMIIQSRSWGGYTSHSLNQFTVMDGSNLIALDHGDAYPRGIYVSRYPNATTKSACNSTRVFTIKGAVGAVHTGVAVGSLLVTDSSYMTAGNSVAQDETYNVNNVRNIFVTSTPKEGFPKSTTKINWITDYTDKATNVSTPHLVRTDDDRNLLLYTAEGKIHYVYLTEEGEKDSSVKTMDGSLSSCQPIPYDGGVIWYYTQNSAPIFCKIDSEGEATIFYSTTSDEENKLSLNTVIHGMEIGEIFQFKVSDGSDTEPEVTWTSSDETVVTVDDKGQIKALKKGKATITAATEDAKATCTVTVTEPVIPKELILSFTSYEMDSSETFKLEVKPKGFYTAPQITWTSSDQKIATVDKNGIVKPVTEGKVTIIARAGSAESSCEITIVEPDDNPYGLELNHSSYTLEEGETLELEITKASDSNAKRKDPEWKSTDDSVASVEEDNGHGIVTAIKAGTAKIKAIIDDSIAFCRIFVKATPTMESISLNYASHEMKEKETAQLHVKAMIGDSEVDVNADEVEWSSSDPSIVTVDEEGLVKAVKQGKATITAKVEEFTAECEITVTANPDSSENSNNNSSSSSSSERHKTDGTLSAAINKTLDTTTNNGSNGSSSKPSYVVQGSWNRNTDDSWNFTDSNGNLYTNSWGALVNPYADTAAGQTDFDWFFFDESGKMRTGWFVDADGSIYYLNEASDGTRGRMMTGWCWIADANGVQRCYYLNPNSDGTKGKLLVNTVIDGYTINENGEWTIDGVVQTK